MRLKDGELYTFYHGVVIRWKYEPIRLHFAGV